MCLVYIILLFQPSTRFPGVLARPERLKKRRTFPGPGRHSDGAFHFPLSSLPCPAHSRLVRGFLFSPAPARYTSPQRVQERREKLRHYRLERWAFRLSFLLQMVSRGSRSCNTEGVYSAQQRLQLVYIPPSSLPGGWHREAVIGKPHSFLKRRLLPPSPVLMRSDRRRTPVTPSSLYDPRDILPVIPNCTCGGGGGTVSPSRAPCLWVLCVCQSFWESLSFPGSCCCSLV